MRKLLVRRIWAAGLVLAGAMSITVEEARAQATGTGATATGSFAAAYGSGATASGDFSIAVGPGATSGGDRGIAIGAGASASHDQSVAIGGGAETTRGPLASYVAPFVAGPQTSRGEVSIGTPSVDEGNRQLTGVAAGHLANDAVNLAQLQGAVAYMQGMYNPQLDALTGRVDRLEHRIEDVRDIAISAGALSMAAAQLRFDDRPGKLSVAMGGGAFHGQGAGAIGIGYTSADRLWRANVSGSFTEGEAAFGGGVSFTLN